MKIKFRAKLGSSGDHKQLRLATDVSGQSIVPILKGHLVQEDGMLDPYLEMSLNTNIRCVTSQKSERSRLRSSGSLKSRRLKFVENFILMNSVSLKKQSPGAVFVILSISFKLFPVFFFKFVFAE